jgi:hypothetical protein
MKVNKTLKFVPFNFYRCIKKTVNGVRFSPSSFQIPYAYVKFSRHYCRLNISTWLTTVADAIFMHIQIPMSLKEDRRINVIICS